MRWSLAVGSLWLALAGCGDDDDDDDDDTSAADAGAADAQVEGGADASQGDPLLVEIEQGLLRGATVEGARAFRGIPYAAPPLGELRWAPPQAPPTWEGERDASDPGPPCPQTAFFGGPLAGSNEDCLTLDVWAPEEAEQLPVMVWIHGGGFNGGAGAEPLYDGAPLVEHGVVLVTMNYRLGALGFLWDEGLGEGAGNYGLLDQRAALEWVQENVAAFGGDPDNVTIFGESAGAACVCLHLVLEESHGLFHRAITQSGSCALPFSTPAQAATVADRLAYSLRCDEAEDRIGCLRAVPALDFPEALNVAYDASFLGGFLWSPVVEGAVIPQQPEVAVEAGAMAPVPVLSGTNANEGSASVFLDGVDVSEELFEEVVRLNVGDGADDVFEAYPLSDFESTADALAELLGDAAFVCPARRLARGVDSAGHEVFVYWFTRAPTIALASNLGSFHTAELPFVFGNDYADLGFELSGDDFVLSSAIQELWTSFARSGTPGPMDDFTWTSWTDEGRDYAILDLPLPFELDSDLHATRCDMWDTVSLLP